MASIGIYTWTCSASKTSALLALSGAALCLNGIDTYTHVDYSCLDDEELGLLGIPWAEYAFIAGQLGLDVLR